MVLIFLVEGFLVCVECRSGKDRVVMLVGYMVREIFLGKMVDVVDFFYLMFIS